MRLLAEMLTRWGWVGNGTWWRAEHVWLALAALILPFGWVLFFVPLDTIRARLQPVRVRVRSLIRR